MKSSGLGFTNKTALGRLHAASYLFKGSYGAAFQFVLVLGERIAYTIQKGTAYEPLPLPRLLPAS